MDIKTLLGHGKTFTGAIIMIALGVLGWLGWLPAGVHIDTPPAQMVSMGLVALGLGYKLQQLINLLSTVGLGSIAGQIVAQAGTPAPDASKTQAHWLVSMVAIPISLAVAIAGCSQTQLASYTSAANATLAVVKQVGTDLVRFDCSNAGLIYVIAQDANATARVKAALAKNAAIAKDACPAILGSAAVVVQTGAVVQPAS